MTAGGKNLIILGVGSIVIALVTSGVSLAVYHNSGDIYLDRSRPGFLPDEEEASAQETDYTFSDKGGEITEAELDEYLKNLDEVQDYFNAVPAPFSAESLSDASLNIDE